MRGWDGVMGVGHRPTNIGPVQRDIGSMMVEDETLKRGRGSERCSGNADRCCSPSSSSVDRVGEGRWWDLHLYNECPVQQRFSKSTNMQVGPEYG